MSTNPTDAVARLIENLKATTGKTLEEWAAVLKATGLDKHAALVAHLKAEHGLTHGRANMIVLKARGTDAGSMDDEGLVAAMFAGDKVRLRPTYDAILAACGSYGADVEAQPKKGYVSLRRRKQFALAQPSTKDRLDLGLNLKGLAPAGRLEASGSFNAMVTHRVRLGSEAEVDAELLGWLRAAYDAAG
jgi:hypothetical protein